MDDDRYDITVIGAGIVGLATSLMLAARYPGRRIAVVEKEAEVAAHQTGHNSGVIHGGIYYKPGSLKARLCVEGGRRMMAFCRQHDIPFEQCGKVVIATSERERPGLEELHRRGVANGVPDLRLIDSAELRAIEPHARGIVALHAPHTGIVDYRVVARAMADDIRAQGGRILTGRRVLGIREAQSSLRIVTDRGPLHTGFLVNCAGLYSDVIAEMTGARTGARIIPFRGEYYFLRPERQSLVRGLIYPVPDPDLPFLGVHFTRTIHGQVEAGPNAVFALAREGYAHTAVSIPELRRTLTFPGFWRMTRRYWRSGLDEFRRSLSPTRFAHSLQQLVPEITAADLVRGGAGVRAQAVDAAGKLVDDFLIAEAPRAVHVLNAPSPAATASLAIGEYIAAVVTRAHPA